MIGQTISHYRILQKLGKGGKGVVYKAEDTKFKRTAAFKLPQAIGIEEAKPRFIHEAQAGAALNHPNICTVYEIDEYENRSFIAMECIEGESLKAKIESSPLQLNETIKITGSANLVRRTGFSEATPLICDGYEGFFDTKEQEPWKQEKH